MVDVRWGVSPAYHISRYGDEFSPEEVAASLDEIATMGFSTFQLEVFHPETLSDWAKRGINLVARAVERKNMVPSQLVGHFLLHGFSSIQAIEADFGVKEIAICLDLVKPFPDCGVITIVIPALASPFPVLKWSEYKNLWKRFVEKLEIMLAIVENGGKKLALEIMPGSIVGGIQGLARLIAEVGGDTLGYNFDTGHAWASREIAPLIPAMLGSKILGTHLKDNAQNENLSLAPGRGTIPWESLIPNLFENGYQGTWDLEIRCNPDEVRSEYEYGLQFLRSKMHHYKGV